MEPYLYGCSVTGQSMNDLPAWMSGAPLSCTLSLGAGYKVQMYYQYSRYRSDETVPTFAVEWVPATVPATATTLNQPGKLQFWYHDWELHPGENALRVRFEQSRINPSVPLRYPDRGDTSVTTVGGVTNTSIAAGTTKVIVEASECGVAFAGASFTLDAAPKFIGGSGGHIHDLAGARDTPPGGEIATFPGISGTTGPDGRWESSSLVTAGEFAGEYELKIKTADLRIDSSRAWPATSRSARLMVAFSPLALRPLSTTGIDFIKLVGHNNVTECGRELLCDNHQNISHYGHPKLHFFIGRMAALYRLEVDATAILPINDMSLPFGGAFDIAGNWQVRKDAPKPGGGVYSWSGHITHRIGADVDVNASTTVNGRTITIKEAELDRIVKKKLSGTKITEPTIHYRLPAADIDSIVGDVR